MSARLSVMMFLQLDGGSTLTLEQWRNFWYIPAAFAAAVMVFFGLASRDRLDRGAERAPQLAAGPPLEPRAEAPA